MKSIIQSKRECWACREFLNLRTLRGLEEHHVFQGVRRAASEQYGLKVYLCYQHHRGASGVHFDPALAASLKKEAQSAFERRYNRAAFIKIFGKNYKDGEEKC